MAPKMSTSILQVDRTTPESVGWRDIVPIDGTASLAPAVTEKIQRARTHRERTCIPEKGAGGQRTRKKTKNKNNEPSESVYYPVLFIPKHQATRGHNYETTPPIFLKRQDDEKA